MGGRIRKAKPAAKRRASSKKKNGANGHAPPPPPKELLELGEPPDDPLAAQAYMLKMVLVMAKQVSIDTSFPTRERSKELRSLGNTVRNLVPKARLYQAEQTVLADKEELEKSSRERRSAKLEARPRVIASAQMPLPMAAQPDPPPAEHGGEEPEQ